MPGSVTDTREVDVVVVGAGLSGLAAAARLRKGGLSVLVLEARDRVGGRLESGYPREGAWVDFGGAWIGPTQPRVNELAAEYGIGTFDQFDDGARLLELAGRVRRYKGTIPRLDPLTLIDVARLQLGVSRACRKIAGDGPTAQRHAAEFDRITLGDWLRQKRCGSAARAMLTSAGKTIWGSEPDDISLFYALRYINGAGGLDALIDTEGGAQHTRLVGGLQELALRMAERLGEIVRLEHAVDRIAADDQGVTVSGPAGAVRAGHAIVALPPPLCRRIDFTPELPDNRRVLQEHSQMGTLTKCFAIYQRPFWRKQGLCGESNSDAGPATLTFDVSPPDDSCGVLLGFVGGGDAQALDEQDDAGARAAVLAGFARLFGDDALNPDDFVLRRWAREQWSGGGPVMTTPPGVLSSAGVTGGDPAGGGALTEPAGRVLWAGTEAAVRWSGYIEGAVQAGEAAADAAVARA